MSAEKVQWFDPFTRMMLIVGLALLLCIFGSAYYMSIHKMAARGTDDQVNDLASQSVHVQHHPFVELPGDAEVSAFSVANFFAGLIVGHNWKKLFETPKKEEA
jgi:cobalt/nickel transport protein